MEEYILNLNSFIISFTRVCFEDEVERINNYKIKSIYLEEYEKSLTNESGEIVKKFCELSEEERELWYQAAIDKFFRHGGLMKDSLFDTWVYIPPEKEKIDAIKLEFYQVVRKVSREKYHRNISSSEDIIEMFSIKCNEDLYNYYAAVLSQEDEFRENILESFRKDYEKYYKM